MKQHSIAQLSNEISKSSSLSSAMSNDLENEADLDIQADLLTNEIDLILAADQLLLGNDSTMNQQQEIHNDDDDDDDDEDEDEKRVTLLDENAFFDEQPIVVSKVQRYLTAEIDRKDPDLNPDPDVDELLREIEVELVGAARRSSPLVNIVVVHSNKFQFYY